MDNKDQRPSMGERFSAAVAALRDPNGQKDIRDGVVAEAKNTAELLATATKKPEKIVEQAQAQVAIVEKASADLQAMAASTDTPNPAEINKIVSTAEAAEKALDAQEAALKSAQEAFDKSNQDLSKAKAESDPAKDADLKKLNGIVDAGNEAMAAIAPAREVLYKMWLEDCQAVADVIAGKKKPEDIRKPVVHTLMGALDAYIQDPNRDSADTTLPRRFKVDPADKPELDKVIADKKLPTIIGGNPLKAIGIDPKKFNEAAYNEARAKKAVIDRDSAPVALRPEQAAKVEQKKKLDKAIADVDAEKTKLGEAQGKIDTSRKALEAKVNEAATAAFDKVQQMIEGLSKAVDEKDPGKVLDAKARREKLKVITDAWAAVLKQFKEAYPERAEEVRKNLADLADTLTKKEQSEKSGKSSPLDFHRLFAIWDGIRHSEAAKFVGGIVRSVLPRREGANQDAKREAAEVVDSEPAAREWVDRITNKVRLTPSYKQAPYWTVPREMRDTYEELLKAEGESIYSEADQEKLFVLTEECGRANGKLEAYNTHHKELEELLEKAEKYIEKAKEIALKINIQKIETRITELTDMPNVTDEDKRARLTDYSEITESWSELIKTLDYMSQEQINAINAKIAALSDKLFPKQEVSNKPGNKILPHRVLEWAKLVPGWFARKRAEAKAAIGGVFHRQAKENKPAGEADAEVDPQDEEEARQRLEKLRSEEQSCINGRVNYAYRTVHEDMIDDLNTQLKEAGDYVETDRDQFFALMDLCTNAQDVVAAYIKNRAELKALLAKAQAYADKAEEIARELNGAAANTAGKSGEAGGAGVAREPTTALEVLERLKPIQERCSRLSGGLDRARKSVEDKRNLPQYDKEIAAYEASIGGAPSLTELLRLLNAIEKNEHIVAMYGRRHGEVETRLAAIEKHILEAQDIARRLNTEQSPPGGATGDPAPGSSREVPGNKSEVLTSEVAIRAWIESAKSKYESYLNRARVTLEGMSKEMSEKEEHDFKRTPEVLKYSDAVEELERLLNEVINGFNSSQRSEFLSSERFSELRTKVDKLDDECNRRLTAIESAWKNFLDNKKKTRK